jgi:8-oxo-dGTP pyrophosphatase MutT (NUDIX family)
VTPIAIRRVTRLDLRFVPWPWPFAERRRDEIDAHFAALRKATPQLWNGRVLLARQPRFREDCFAADCFETDFASFLAWRDWGFPDDSVVNCFGAGALRGCDGAFVLGEMADHTANAGRIYFPAGTPDPNDIRDGIVDIAGSIVREVEEETGLVASDYRAAPYWDCVIAGRLIGLIRILESDVSSGTLRQRIETNLSGQSSPELSAIHIVRRHADLTPAMPAYARAFLEATLSDLT